MIARDAFLFDVIVAKFCSSYIMQRDAIRMRSRPICRRLVHIPVMANDRTVGPAADGIISAERGVSQQERPIEQPGG